MKLSTIGTSAICQLALDSMKDIDNIELVTAYSRKLDQAKDYANTQGFKKYTDSLEELFSDPDADTIYIASPNALHYNQAKAALEHGKNVILEKPFTSTLEETKDLFETAEKNGVMIFEAITNYHTPNFALLKEALPKAGNLKTVLLNLSQYSSRYDNYKQKIVQNAFDPKMDGGALVDINVYNLHLAHGLFGKPEKVTYLPNYGFNGIDTSGIVILEYPDFQVMAVGAKDSSTAFNSYIAGDEGTFYIEKSPTSRLEFVKFVPQAKGAKEEVVSEELGKNMSYEFRDFANAIDNQDKDAYNTCKAQTIGVMELICESKAQRDAKNPVLKA